MHRGPYRQAAVRGATCRRRPPTRARYGHVLVSDVRPCPVWPWLGQRLAHRQRLVHSWKMPTRHRDDAPGVHHVWVNATGNEQYYLDEVDRMAWLRGLINATK